MAKDIIFTSRNDYKHEPDTKKIYDTIVIGSGVAGYSSAMYASRLGLKVLIIGEIPGGTLALTGKVENYPGFVSIDGQKLTELLENHAMDYDTDYLTEIVDGIEKEKDMFKVRSGKKQFFGKTIIFATGAKVKKLGVKGEEEFFGNGVAYCALCDAANIKGKIAAIAGGGDSAVKEAVLLTEYAKKVYIINNEKKIHPEMENQKKINELLNKKKIEILNENEILEIKGKGKMDRVILKNEYKGNKELYIDGLFIYIGHVPESSLAKSIGVRIDKRSEIIINSHSETNIQGFFAAGDVTNLEWKQAIIGVAQGVTAAYYAYKYINKIK
jgi:thioredoxin reductase (NADPH)